jgi:hypothetical protein
MKTIRQLNLYFCMMCLSLDWIMIYLTNWLVSSLFYVPRCKWLPRPKGINSLREFREQNLKFIWQKIYSPYDRNTASKCIFIFYSLSLTFICLKYVGSMVSIYVFGLSMIIPILIIYLGEEKEENYKKKFTKLSLKKKKEWFIKAHIFLVFPLIILIILIFI